MPHLRASAAASAGICPRHGGCFGGLSPCLRYHTYYTIFCGCMHAGGGPRGLFRGLHILSTHSLQTVQASIKLYSHSSCNIRIATRAHHIGKRKAQAPRQAPCALVLRAACGTPLPNARRGLPKEPCAGRSPLHKGTKQAGPPVMLLCMGPPGGNRQSFGTAEGFYINRYVFPLLSQQHGCPLSPFGAGGHSCLYRELYKMVSAAPFTVWMWYNMCT